MQVTESTINYWDAIPHEVAIKAINKDWLSIDLINIRLVCKRFHILVDEAFSEMSKEIANSAPRRALVIEKLPANISKMAKLVLQIKALRQEALNLGYNDLLAYEGELDLSKRMAGEIAQYPKIIKVAAERSVLVKSYMFVFQLAKSLKIPTTGFTNKFLEVKDRTPIDQLWQRIETKKGLDKIKHLKFPSDLAIRDIPDEIAYLKNVKKIEIYGSKQLYYISPKIQCLSMLEELTIEDCSLITLPNEITKLTSLTLLHLGSNRLQTLPEGIKNLTSLKILLIANNRFTSLPDELEQLPSLEQLYIDRNRFTAPPSVITKLGQSKPNLKITS